MCREGYYEYFREKSNATEWSNIKNSVALYLLYCVFLLLIVRRTFHLQFILLSQFPSGSYPSAIEIPASTYPN
jgi:hypothetical protein